MVQYVYTYTYTYTYVYCNVVPSYVTYVLYTYVLYEGTFAYLRRRLALYTTTHSVVYVYSTRTRTVDLITI